MKISMRELQDEYEYSITMVFVKKTPRRKIISLPEYWRTNRKMEGKYRPITEGLISESDLIYRRKRANMGARKEAGSVENPKG